MFRNNWVYRLLSDMNDARAVAKASRQGSPTPLVNRYARKTATKYASRAINKIFR